MATKTPESPPSKPKGIIKQIASSGAAQAVEKKVKPLGEFFTKFNNDWVMNFAAGLAYNILTAIFPIAIAIISITGLVVGALDPIAKRQLIQSISAIFPSTLSSNGQNVLEPVLISLSRNAGLLGIIAILLAVFGGSRLFVTLEGYFDVIYHTRPRDLVKQNIMAFFMMLLFIVLVPIMIFAASGAAFVFSLLQQTPLGKIPGSGLLFGLGGPFVGLVLAWVLFLGIYIVVPNQHIALRNSWLGALVAAVLVQLYLTLFPFYVTRFMNSYTGPAGAAGFAVILLIFIYYFAVILLLGAEVNAFFAEGIHTTPQSISVMVHQITSHLPTSKRAVEQQASVSHKEEEPKAIIQQSEEQQLTAQAKAKAVTTEHEQITRQDQTTYTAQRPKKEHHPKKEKGKTSSQGFSKGLTIAEAVTGTALAFLVEFFRLRRKQGF